MNSAHTFGLSPRRQYFLLAAAAFFCLFPTALVVGGLISGDTAAASAGMITACIMLPFVAFMLFWAYYPRLTVDASGINLRGTIGLASIFVPWKNVERLRLTPMSEGFILRDPLDTKATQKLRNYSGVVLRGAAMYDQEQRQFMSDLRYVPFEAFAHWLDRGTLLRAIEQYAPNLVSNFTAERAAAKRIDPRDKRIIIVVSAIAVLALITAVLFGIYGESLSTSTQAKLASVVNTVTYFCLWLAAAGLTVYTCVNLRSAWQLLRERQYGQAVLWSGLAAMQVLVILAIIGAQG